MPVHTKKEKAKIVKRVKTQKRVKKPVKRRGK